jgi:hypothetical protein
VSHDEGSNDAKKSGNREPSLHDTVPGVPDMELGRTLPTGAAFHVRAATYDSAASTMPNTPASLPRHDDPSAPQDGARPSSPPSGTGGPLTFGSTHKEFVAPKLSAREKAKRNVLTHTLQMPLVVTPLPPAAADVTAGAAAVRRATIKGTQPPASPLPAGWTSMHRVGSGAPPEPSSSRPASQRSTDPLNATRSGYPGRGDHSERFERADQNERADPSQRFQHSERTDPSERFQRAEPVTGARDPRAQSTLQDAPYGWQNPSGSAPRESFPRWNDRERIPDYERETLPGTMAVRIPALSAREWMFIALLACASAATLYSLLIDDVTTPVEDEAETAMSTAPEHLVKPAPVPASPKPTSASASASASRPAAESEAKPAPLAAASSNVTEIVSEPAHAEIVVGGAVIGNTPAQVVRGDKDADYLLRKPGYEPQLVRVTPHSPKSITITLHAKQ